MVDKEAASLPERPGETHSPAGRAVALCLLLAFAAVPAAALEVSAVALFKSRAMLNIDGRQRLLQVGETSPEGVTLVQADAAGARVVIAGQEQVLTLDRGCPKFCVRGVT